MMLRYVTSTLAAVALASTMSVLAQEPTPAPAQPDKPQVPKETLTGCVGEAKTTTGTTVYVLDKTEGGSTAMYVLGTSPQFDWKTNINKKIEVTGPVQQPNAAPADEGAAGAPKPLRPPLMQAESMKVVADTCK
jgi:hypothetical protein